MEIAVFMNVVELAEEKTILLGKDFGSQCGKQYFLECVAIRLAISTRSVAIERQFRPICFATFLTKAFYV